MLTDAVSTLITGGLGAGTNILNGIGNFITNQQNLKFQKDNLQYQKDLQKQIFQREDTAVQRRVADLVSAGLSPTLASGSAAQAGSVVQTEAPKSAWSEVSTGGFLDMMKAKNEVQMQNQAKAKTQQEIAFLNSQIDNMNAQTVKLNIDNGFESQLKTAMLNQMLANTNLTESQREKVLNDIDYYNKTVEKNIALLNQNVLRGNMENWRLGYGNAMLHNFGYDPLHMPSLTGSALAVLGSAAKKLRDLFPKSTFSDVNQRPSYQMY